MGVTAQDQQSRAEFPSGIAAASVLRAMAMNYRTGHAWDALDERACTSAANEIDRLNAELQAARALPASMKPVAEIYAGDLFRVNQGADAEPVTGDHDLYTAAQVLAMGRVPPGWQAVPVEPAIAIADSWRHAKDQQRTDDKESRSLCSHARCSTSATSRAGAQAADA